MRTNHNYLFFDYDFGDSLRSHEAKMSSEVDVIEGSRLLNTPIEDWVNYLEQEFKVNVPKIKDDQITVDQGEKQVDVSRDPNRIFLDRNEPFYVAGTEITFYVPFEGDSNLFKCKPSTYSLNPPRGEISDSELVLSYSRTDHDAEAVKAEFEKELSQIKQNLERLSGDATPFNSGLKDKIRERIQERREKLLADQGVVAALGYQLRRREDMPQTYAVPIAPKKIIPRPTPKGDTPFKPEPALDMKQYEDILSTVCNMALVLERSPKAFSGMEEEDLRQHFLVQLNGLYQGQATGETFNFEGKTDILLRVEGKNIFIAECKFWKGPAALKDTLDQLLDYTSWRDTKTAIILFNRTKSLSSVLEKIPPVVRDHPNFKRDCDYKSETGFRYILSHKDDSNRELTLTILVFEVPVD